jgi:hypothetical protein
MQNDMGAEKKQKILRRDDGKIFTGSLAGPKAKFTACDDLCP